MTLARRAAITLVAIAALAASAHSAGASPAQSCSPRDIIEPYVDWYSGIPVNYGAPPRQAARAQAEGEVMPSKSPKQARLMAAVAHNPKFAAKVGIPVKVGKEFNAADAGTGILGKLRRPRKAR